MSFGFSVGDFIAGCEIIWEVSQALRDSRGSSASFKSLILELRSFETALFSVRRHVEPLSGLKPGGEQGESLHQLIDACRSKIEDILKRIDGYHKHLGRAQDAHKPNLILRIKGSAAKIRWLSIEKDLPDLKASVASHTVAINTIMDSITIDNLNEIRRTQAAQNQQIETGLNNITSQIRRVSSGLTVNADNHATTLVGLVNGLLALMYQEQSTSQAEAARNETFRRTITEVLEGQSQCIQRLENNLQALTLLVASTLGNAVKPHSIVQSVFFLEDCLGNTHNVNMTAITGWDELHAFLESRFHNLPGATLVHQRKYTFSIANDGRRIRKRDAWSNQIHPGSRIVMSVCFQMYWRWSETCPGCGGSAGDISAAERTCSSCGLTYRQIEGSEVNDGEGNEVVDGRSYFHQSGWRLSDFRRVQLLEISNADSFNALLTQFNELQQQTMTENLEMQKAQAFWNPLESMSKRDATS